MKALLLLVLLLSTGCMQQMDELHIDPGFRLEEQEAIIQAVDDICAAGGPCIPVYVGRSKEQWVRKVDDCGDYYARTLLRAHRKPRIEYCESDPYTMMLHELGHALSGRVDHLGEGTVMHPAADHPTLTEADIRYINEARKE